MIQKTREVAFGTRNDLSSAVRSQMIDLLNEALADAVDLSTQLKQAHWNVKGPNFIGLHKLFDKIVGAVREYADDIAERAVALGGVALGTARRSADRSRLAEYPAGISAGQDHVRAVSDALASFGARTREATDTADEAGDMATSDLFIEITRAIDKWLWFVEAHGQASE
jgi:starvation-inducible DNA-binding protein